MERVKFFQSDYLAAVGRHLREMTEPKVTEEVSYRTVTTTKGATTSNKRTIVSRTSNVNAVQVNCYDADGNLKSKDMDQNSWEERDTHNYEWDGGEKPPQVDAVLKEEEAGRRVFNGECQAIETKDDSSNTIVLTSTNVCNTPSISWTGTVNESEVNPDSERSSATKLEGSKWIHSEESVSMSMGKSGFPKSFNVKVSDFNGALMSDAFSSNKDGKNDNTLVTIPSSETSSKKEPVPAIPPPSPAERRQMRRNVNREMVSGKTRAEK